MLRRPRRTAGLEFDAATTRGLLQVWKLKVTAAGDGNAITSICGDGGELCPFEFNFNPTTFKVGAVVSFRIPIQFQDFPFVGTILAVYNDCIELTSDPKDPTEWLKATCASRPVVEQYG